VGAWGARAAVMCQNLILYIDFTYLCNYTGYIPSEGLGIY
jgi:hypothetical protein